MSVTLCVVRWGRGDGGGGGAACIIYVLMVVIVDRYRGKYKGRGGTVGNWVLGGLARSGILFPVPITIIGIQSYLEQNTHQHRVMCKV